VVGQIQQKLYGIRDIIN